MADRKLSEEEVDDIIEEFHEAYPNDESNVEIYDMLGWTSGEYFRWVQTGEIPDPDVD